MAVQILVLDDGKVEGRDAGPLIQLFARVAALETKLDAVRSIAEQPVSGSPPSRIEQLEQKFQDIADALA